MTTYHINAKVTQEMLWRVQADDPRKAVELLYEALYRPVSFRDNPSYMDVEAIQDEGVKVEMVKVWDTTFVGYNADAPLVDETDQPGIDVDLSEPAQYGKYHSGMES